MVNKSIFAGGLVRDDAYGNPADSSSTVGHATVRVEGVKVRPVHDGQQTGLDVQTAVKY